MRTNLKDHAIRVHKMSLMNAKALRSQTKQMHRNRVAKKRVYHPYVCPVPMCGKVIKRPHNHLKDTHRIKDKKMYQFYLDKMESFIDVDDRTESEFEEEYSSDNDNELKVVKKILKKGGIDYLRRVKDEIVNSEDESDKDWLEVKVNEVAEKKEKQSITTCDFFNLSVPN